ncbi:MAG: lysophospholipid acyltransferase family protein [Chloroflexota bacterium]
MNLLHAFVCWVVRGGTLVLCKIDRRDLELVPNEGPLIIVTNHIGSLEVPLLYAHLQPRQMTGFAKEETWDNPIMGWLFDLWGAIPVRRGEADLDALRSALAALENGDIFTIAPEGTRSKHGRLLRGHPGVISLAMHSGARILPVAHWGGESFVDNIKRFRRTKFNIRVGKPFRLSQSKDVVNRRMRQDMTDAVMCQLAALLPEEYRGEYADLSFPVSEYICKDQLSHE